MWNIFFIGLLLSSSAVCDVSHLLHHGYPAHQPDHPLELPGQGPVTGYPAEKPEQSFELPGKSTEGYPVEKPDQTFEIPDRSSEIPGQGTAGQQSIAELPKVEFQPPTTASESATGIKVDIVKQGEGEGGIVSIQQDVTHDHSHEHEHHYHGQDGKYNPHDDGTGWDIRNSVPGEPDRDYPVYDSVPSTGFTCRQKVPGYYADEEARCQVFRICTTDSFKTAYNFLCPNGTLFNQRVLTCDWWMNVDCERSSEFFFKNEEIGKMPAGQKLMTEVTKMLNAPDKNPYYFTQQQTDAVSQTINDNSVQQSTATKYEPPSTTTVRPTISTFISTEKQTADQSSQQSFENVVPKDEIVQQQFQPTQNQYIPPRIELSSMSNVQNQYIPPKIDKPSIQYTPPKVDRPSVFPVQKPIVPPKVSQPSVILTQKPFVPQKVSQPSVVPVQKPYVPPKLVRPSVLPTQKPFVPQKVSQPSRPVPKPFAPPKFDQPIGGSIETKYTPPVLVQPMGQVQTQEQNIQVGDQKLHVSTEIKTPPVLHVSSKPEPMLFVSKPITKPQTSASMKNNTENAISSSQKQTEGNLYVSPILSSSKPSKTDGQLFTSMLSMKSDAQPLFVSQKAGADKPFLSKEATTSKPGGSIAMEQSPMNTLQLIPNSAPFVSTINMKNSGGSKLYTSEINNKIQPLYTSRVGKKQDNPAEGQATNKTNRYIKGNMQKPFLSQIEQSSSSGGSDIVQTSNRAEFAGYNYPKQSIGLTTSQLAQQNNQQLTVTKEKTNVFSQVSPHVQDGPQKIPLLDNQNIVSTVAPIVQQQNTFGNVQTQLSVTTEAQKTVSQTGSFGTTQTQTSNTQFGQFGQSIAQKPNIPSLQMFTGSTTRPTGFSLPKITKEEAFQQIDQIQTDLNEISKQQNQLNNFGQGILTPRIIETDIPTQNLGQNVDFAQVRFSSGLHTQIPQGFTHQGAQPAFFNTQTFPPQSYIQNQGYQHNFFQQPNFNTQAFQGGFAQNFNGPSFQQQRTFNGQNAQFKGATKVDIVPALGFHLNDNSDKERYFSAISKGLIGGERSHQVSSGSGNFRQNLYSPSDVRFSSYQGPSSYLVPQSSVQRLPNDFGYRYR